MLRPWLNLLRVLGRHALVAVGIVVVLMAPLPVNCMPCGNSNETASGFAAIDMDAAAVVASDDGQRNPLDPVDPQPCDHCHCTAPAALAPDHSVKIPATLVSRHLVPPVPTHVPDDPVFVPDPPPQKA